MTMIMPDPKNFIFWCPLDEVSGSRYDQIKLRAFTDNNTVGQGTGHVSPRCADFERGNSEFLSIADASWNTFGNESIYLWDWFKIENVFTTMTLFGKFNEPNDHEYGLWFETGVRPKVGIARGGHSWETTAQGGSGLISAATWYMALFYYNAVTDFLGLKIYNTSGSVVTSGSAWNNTGFGASGDSVDLRIGANMPGGSGSPNYFDGLQDQFAGYKGELSADEEAWVVNGGAGRAYPDLIAAGGVPIFY